MTWTESRWGRGALAIALTVAAACGDDDKKNTDDKDGSTTPVGSFDSGTTTFDGGTITHLPDGGEVVIGNDGAIISQPGSGMDGGGSNDGNDAGGGGNNGGCATNCNDGIDCTLDTCVSGQCQHTIDVRACSAGSSCDPMKGCQAGAACSMNSECADMNACTVNERCDQASKRCLFDPLDGDGDGYAPSSCGGADCDDANGLIRPNATEICDGVDSDCSGVADDHLTAVAGQTCSMGQAACMTGTNFCPPNATEGAGCRDLKNDAQHCGTCGTSCGNAGTCVDGKCSETCPAPAMQCDAYCSDLKTSNTNCGACGGTCVGSFQQSRTCLAGACAPCGNEGQACCTSETTLRDALGAGPCNGALTCSGTAGAAGSTCGCAAPASKCGNTCVDLRTDHNNCGACGTACTNGQACITDSHGTACVACGGLGEACCDGGNALPCRGGRLCAGTNTCVEVSTGNPGGNGR